jgi:Insertion element 4 transposase N-terminal/Transposase DDE domain
MPRRDHAKSTMRGRLSDRIAIGVLTRTYPPELIDEVVAATGRAEQRHRLLPARMVVYYVLAMALFSEQAYEEVARLLTEGLAWAHHLQGPWQVPSKSAIAQGRARLGWEPLKALFDRAAWPLATRTTRQAWYRRWRLMAIGGAMFDVAGTPANAATFGWPSAGRRQRSGAFPQVRLVGLAEVGTRTLVGAAIGACAAEETALVASLASSCQREMLVMADCGFPNAKLWRQLSVNGADLLWWTESGTVLSVDKALPDGSYLSHVKAARDQVDDRVVVRVVEYALNDPGRPELDAPSQLLTTILDPAQAPAAELAALYAKRWKLETILADLKTRQREAAGLVLRSKTPDGVYQELYGHLLIHYAIRALMHDAAPQIPYRPEPGSFLPPLRVMRRHITGQAAFSP